MFTFFYIVIYVISPIVFIGFILHIIYLYLSYLANNDLKHKRKVLYKELNNLYDDILNKNHLYDPILYDKNEEIKIKIKIIDLKNKIKDIEIKDGQIKSQSTQEIRGILQEIQHTNVFFKDDGSYGFVTKITVQTTDGKKHLTVWDEQVKNLQQFSAGDSVTIKNVSKREKNGFNELHINGYSTIEKN